MFEYPKEDSGDTEQLPEPEDTETKEDTLVETEEEHEIALGNLTTLWKKYHGIGSPPLPGSPVEKRLILICRRYMQHVFNNTRSPLTPTKQRENTEDYFAQFRTVRQPDSETSRRELHNQIGLMLLGKQRSGMDIQRAEELIEFASELVYGCSSAEALSKKEKGLI